MSTGWTIIGSVGTSLLASGGLVWLCREWISARLTKSIQHEYDIKLEDFKNRIHYEYELKLESSKTDFQTILNERQTRFKYWHDEKAKAIKELYEDACKLYFSLLSLHVFNRMHKDKDLEESQKNEWNEMRNTISTQKLNVANNWYLFRLFLNDEEDDAFNEFGKATNEWSKMLDKKYDQKEVLDKGEEYNDSIKDLLGNLRTVFREALCDATSDTSLNDGDRESMSSNIQQDSQKAPPGVNHEA